MMAPSIRRDHAFFDALPRLRDNGGFDLYPKIFLEEAHDREKSRENCCDDARHGH